VSHDRAFIDRLGTRVLDLRGGRAVAMDGNYSETAVARADRRKRPEADAGAFSSTADRAASPGATHTHTHTRTDTRDGPSGSTPPATTKGGSRGRRDDSRDGEAVKRRRRIKGLEEKIAALEAEVARLEARLWEEALTLGPVASRNLAAEKAARKDELDALVDEWAKLSEEESAPAGSRP
jgi:ATPase subunit of ABC transporter with duplicated ATPase domains